MGSVAVYTDGASRGNPGQAAIGYAMFDSTHRIIEKNSKCIGRRTNNEAEYEALLWAMNRVLACGYDRAEFFSDSELMVRQMNGRYRIRVERLKALADKVKIRKAMFSSFRLIHVAREDPGTQLADALVNDALDTAGF